jgi:hypothetical protein
MTTRSHASPMPDVLATEPLIDLTHAAKLYERELGHPVNRKSLPPLVMSHGIEGRPYGKGFRLTLFGYRRLREIVKAARRREAAVGYRGLGDGGASEN